MVPQVQTAEMPVSTQKMVSQDIVSRVAVCGPHRKRLLNFWPLRRPRFYSGPAVSSYGGVPIGGIARLNQDPPRYGVGMNQSGPCATR